MELDVVLLARLQFALTIMFHYLFPPLSIGLGWIMVYLEGQYLRTRDPAYEQAARFWTKLFAVNFALGVASGIVMEFQFGTNWAVYSAYVGDVFGSALAAEGIFAFFLESGFLAVLVFGWDKVGPRMHFFSTLMVAIGATFSAVWIIVANSWQQTPAGYHIVGEGLAARAEITDFWAMVFSPSSMHRLNHTLIGCLILAGFFVMSISAYYLLKNRHREVAVRSFSAGLFAALVFSLLAPLSGHLQAQQVAEWQPAKLAAFEGHFKTTDGGAPLYLWGWPSEAEERVRFGFAIPGMLSFLVHESFTEPVTALDAFPEEDRPPVVIPFLTYHLMVAIGMFNIALAGYAGVLWWRGNLFQTRWLLWIIVFAVVLQYAANQAGWIAAEVGRQPWVVYPPPPGSDPSLGEGLRTSEAVSAAVGANQVLGSILMFTVIYALLFVLWLYIMNDKIQKGPDPVPEMPDRTGPKALLDAAAALADKSRGHSLTSAHDDAARNEEQ